MPNPPSIDRIPRYAPYIILCKGQFVSVIKYVIHPKGLYHKDWMTLEFVTKNGSRFRPFEKAWINSELRMVVSGFDSRDEVLQTWEKCKVV